MYESIFSLCFIDFSFFLLCLSNSDSTVLDRMVISSSSGFSVFMPVGSEEEEVPSVSYACLVGAALTHLTETKLSRQKHFRVWI
jgi:hypothetical protein